MTTEERLDKLERENQALKQQLADITPEHKPSYWSGLRSDVDAFAEKRVERNTSSANRKWTLKDSIQTILRYHLDISNIVTMNEEQSVEARKLFEQISKLI